MMWVHRLKAALEKRLFPERAKLWRRWKQHDAASLERIDHAAWRDFLGQYLVVGADDIGRLRYGAVTGEHRRALQDYLRQLAAVPISRFAPDEQFAYWANLYNALTVELILGHYPVRSVRRIGLVPLWLGGGPWNGKLTEVEGIKLSLNDIEHRILRRNWRDPRIHYAVICGSLGCPSLEAEPFQGDRLQAQLDAAARRYINHPRGVSRQADGIRVSSIYVWFKVDFGNSDDGVRAHLQRYSLPPLAEALAAAPQLVGHGYDWRLNDARD